MKGSLIIVSFFIVGIILGMTDLLPVDIQNSQCETAGTLPVLWSDRQYKGSEELSSADKMVIV